MLSQLRVNRPETAAKVLRELSRQALHVSLLFWALSGLFAAIALWDYGKLITLLGVILAAILATLVYLLALQLLVNAWHDIQFYRPTPRAKTRVVPLHTRGRTKLIEVDDRVGG